MSGLAQALPDGPVILDASFLIALLVGEPAAQAHAGVLSGGVVSALALGEVHTALAQRAGIAPATTEETLRALGAHLVDHPVAAAAHLPAVRAAETARRVAQAADGQESVALTSSELGVLAHAMAAALAVLTTNPHQTALTHRLDIDVYHPETTA